MTQAKMVPVSDLFREFYFGYREIFLDEFRSDQNFQSLLQIWLKWWNYESFNKLIFKLLHEKISETQIRLFILYSLTNEKVPLAFIAIQHSNLSSVAVTDRLFLHCIPDPSQILYNYQQFATFLCSNDFWELIAAFCNGSRIDFSTIAYLFFEWPDHPKISEFTQAVSISAKEFQTNFNIRGKWVNYRYFCDEKIIVNGEQIGYRNTLHFLNYNPLFEQNFLPTLLFAQFETASNLYNNYTKNQFPPFLSSELKDFFKQIFDHKAYLNNYKDQIHAKLGKFKEVRKAIWKKIQSAGKIEFAPIFSSGIKELITSMHDFGIRHSLYKIDSPKFLDLLRKYHCDFVMIMLESIPTEGSMWESFLNPTITDLNFLKSKYGEYVGTTEFEIEPGVWTLAGFAPCWYRKPIDIYSTQLMCGLVFLEIFRGFGLAEMLALSGMVICEIHNIADIIYEEATVHNFATKRLVDKIGFESYGLIQNQAYDITALTNPWPFLVGFFRTYRLSTKILEYLIGNTDDKTQKAKFERDFLVNQLLVDAHKSLIKKGILNSLIT